MITAKYNPDSYLQKTGHGDLVETREGDWYAVFLTGRPLTKQGRCITGRETAMERVEWRGDDLGYAASFRGKGFRIITVQSAGTPARGNS